jgi:hypothetical protein
MGTIFCETCNREHEPWFCPKCGFCLVKFGIDEGLKDLMEHTRCDHCGHMILTNVSFPAIPDPEEQDPLAYERTFDQEWGTEDEENDFPLDEVDR